VVIIYKQKSSSKQLLQELWKVETPIEINHFILRMKLNITTYETKPSCELDRDQSISCPKSTKSDVCDSEIRSKT
jgi:hypothetical protein